MREAVEDANDKGAPAEDLRAASQRANLVCDLAVGAWPTFTPVEAIVNWRGCVEDG